MAGENGSSQGGSGLFGLASGASNLFNIFHVTKLLIDPSKPDIPPELLPPNLINQFKAILRDEKHPVTRSLSEQVAPQVDALTSENILDFIRGSDKYQPMEKEQFLALFNNNEGAGKVISEALDAKQNAPLRDLFKTDAKWTFDTTGMTADTSILDKKLSEVGENEFSDFIKGLSDEDTLKVLHQLPVKFAREVIDGLSKEDGKAIKDFPTITLDDEAGPEQKKAAIDKAIAARIDHKDGLAGVFNVFGYVEGKVYDGIRESLGNKVQTQLNEGKAQLAKVSDLEGLYDFLKTAPKESAVEFLGTYLPNIKKELKKPSNMLFLYDMFPDEFLTKGVDFIRNKLDQFPQLGTFMAMAIGFIEKFLGPILQKFGIDITSPYASPESDTQASPSPDTSKPDFGNASSGQQAAQQPAPDAAPAPAADGQKQDNVRQPAAGMGTNP